jgi:hypothetical protein
MAKIYVASSWRNIHQPAVVEALRQLGHEVYDFRNPPKGRRGFQWSAIDPNWENWTTEQFQKALEHPIAQAGFESDFEGMTWADTCVLVLPCGRSAHTEAGFMKGSGKTTVVYSPNFEEPELMYKCYDAVVDNIDDLNTAIAVYKHKLEYRPKYADEDYHAYCTDKHPGILPGVYAAIWSGYAVTLALNNYNSSEPLPTNAGVRGIYNCHAEVKCDGTVGIIVQ